MNFILRIYVPSTVNVAVQHTEILTVILDLTPDISKQPTFHECRLPLCELLHLNP